MEIEEVYIAENNEEVAEEVKEEFVINSDVKADWAFRKLKEIRKDKQDQEMKYLEHKQQVVDWHQSKMTGLEMKEEHFMALLKIYYEEEKTKDPKFEIDTPAGRLSRTTKNKWKYDDEKLVNYLEERDLDDLIKTIKAPKKADIKKAFKLVDGKVYDQNGEEVQGIEVEENEDYNLTLRGV